MKPRLLLALAAFVLALPGLALLPGCGASSTDGSAEPKAAIVDQLYSLRPNQAFIDEATAALEGYGFSVDIYQGDEVNIDLYRQLPSHGHKLIIFRAHCGEWAVTTESDLVEATFLFTSEPYSPTKYASEQRSGQLGPGLPSPQHQPVFAIGHKFVAMSMKGTFSNTVIIMMGCSALRDNEMAQAFVERGASTYLGWDLSVDLAYVDDATLDLISNLCTQGMTVEQAALHTMTKVGPDPIYDAWLRYYPQQSANYTIAELMQMEVDK